jgi:hypothetical protein
MPLASELVLTDNRVWSTSCTETAARNLDVARASRRRTPRPDGDRAGDWNRSDTDSAGDEWTGGSTMKVWLRRWGPAILVMAIIFIASSTPGRDLPRFGMLDLFVKKGGHMLGYALLAAAYVHGLSGTYRISWRTLFIALGLAFLYAVSDEFHQSFTPGRTPAFMDVCIDMGGASVGAIVARYLNGLWPQ